MLKSNIRPMIGSVVPAVIAESFVEEELMDEQDEHVKDFWQKVFSQKQVPSFQVTGINRKTGELDNIQIFSPNTKHDGEYQLTYFDAKGEPINDRMVDQKMIDRIRQGDTLFITSLLPNSNQSLIYTVSYPDDDLKEKSPLIQSDELWINVNSAKSWKKILAERYVYRRSAEVTGHFEREELWKREPNELVFRRIFLRYTIPLFIGSTEGNSQKKKRKSFYH